MSTVFEVKTAGEDGSRYVEANSRVDAFLHVAGDYFVVEPVKAAGLRALVTGGNTVTVEKTKAVVDAGIAAAKAKADAAAKAAADAGGAPQQEVH